MLFRVNLLHNKRSTEIAHVGVAFTVRVIIRSAHVKLSASAARVGLAHGVCLARHLRKQGRDCACRSRRRTLLAGHSLSEAPTPAFRNISCARLSRREPSLNTQRRRRVSGGQLRPGVVGASWRGVVRCGKTRVRTRRNTLRLARRKRAWISQAKPPKEKTAFKPHASLMLLKHAALRSEDSNQLRLKPDRSLKPLAFSFACSHVAWSFLLRTSPEA